MWLANAVVAIMLIPTLFEKDMAWGMRLFFLAAMVTNAIAFYNLLTKGCV